MQTMNGYLYEEGDAVERPGNNITDVLLMIAISQVALVGLKPQMPCGAANDGLFDFISFCAHLQIQ